MLRSNQELGAVDEGENDDGVPGLPALDGEVDDDGALQEDELAFRDTDEDLVDDFEVGLEDEADSWSIQRLHDAKSGDASDSQEAGDLVEGALAISEPRDQGRWSEDDDKPLELGGEALIDALPSIEIDQHEGLGQGADDAGLAPLPPLQGEEVDEHEDEQWLAELALPPLPATLEDAVAAPVTIAPGVQWQMLAGVSLQEFARPEGHGELSLWVSLTSAPLVYLGVLYRFGAGGFERFGGLGLEGEPRTLVSASGDGPRLWAVGAGYVQFSDDGGLTFGPPVVVEPEANLRAAMTAEGSVWMVHRGELLRCRPGELSATKVPCNVQCTDVASDGGKNLLLLGEDGRIHISRDGARSFRYVATWEGTCQGLMMCGDTIVLVTPDRPLVWNDGSFREIFGVSSHALALAQEQGGAVVYGCVPSGASWLLVRIPVVGVGRRPVVVSRLPEHLGAPRFLCVTEGGQQTRVLVGLDQGFAQVQVPSDQE